VTTATAVLTHHIVGMAYTDGRWYVLCECGQWTVTATADEALDAFADHQDGPVAPQEAA
jgi:hypothetical protein